MRVQESGKVSFKEAFKDYWRGYVDFQGSTSRSGYWWMWGFNALIYIILLVAVLICLYYEQNSMIIPFFILAVVYYLVTLIPNIAKQTRRFINLGIATNIAILLVIIYKVGNIFFYGGIELIVFIVNLLPQDFFKSEGGKS